MPRPLLSGRRAVSRALLALAAACAVGVGLSACDRGGQKFQNTDIGGTDIGKEGFALTDHKGVARSLADYRGKVVALFFGFTHCPDVCPTTMVEMAEAVKLLGPKGDQVQVLFVTVDPERDTPEMLASYVPAFHPGFVGLWGTPEDIERTAKAFKVFYQKTRSPSSDSYSVDHSAGSYLFDRDGRIRVFTRYGVGAQSLAHDMGILLER